MSEEQIIHSQQPSYFHMLPNIADEELDPYEYRLLGHYLRVAGGNNRLCFESIRTTAEKCKMSHPMVLEARKRLAELGYVKLHETVFKNVRRVVVTILDFWPRNINHFKDQAASPRQPSFAELIEAQLPGGGNTATTTGNIATGGGSTATSGGNTATVGGSQVSHKNNNIKNNNRKKNKSKKKPDEEKHDDDAGTLFSTQLVKENALPRAIARGMDRSLAFKALTQDSQWHYDNDFIWRLGVEEQELHPALAVAVNRALIESALYQQWDGLERFLEQCSVRQLQHLCLWLFKWIYDGEWAEKIDNPVALFITQLDQVPAIYEAQKAKLAWCLCYWLTGVYEKWKGDMLPA